MTFKESCIRCPRLAKFLAEVRVSHPHYHALPVASFGAPASRFLIVGLAPGMHGANRTGRPFTGDYAGDLLYGTLHKFGFATAAQPLDGNLQANPALHLQGCRITNAVRCLPPQNKPEPSEIKACNGYLIDELAALPDAAAVMALGTIAHQAVLTALGLRKSSFPFAHGARHVLSDSITMFDSYHCSRYNTQTRRLTPAMFEQVVSDVSGFLGCAQGEH
ncbi:MAG: uracil-DNA glycosylase [Gallionella sp.]|nr:uracil-DNA glycosylase [Gallionella sp.]